MDLKSLLDEAFHTYKLYLLCTGIELGGINNLPIFKWPDVAQSAIDYAESSDEDKESLRKILINDLYAVILTPLEAVHDATKSHITVHLGKEPVVKLNTSNRTEHPLRYKCDLIDNINQMFDTLRTMTGVNYPKLESLNGSKY